MRIPIATIKKQPTTWVSVGVDNSFRKPCRCALNGSLQVWDLRLLADERVVENEETGRLGGKLERHAAGNVVGDITIEVDRPAENRLGTEAATGGVQAAVVEDAQASFRLEKDAQNGRLTICLVRAQCRCPPVRS